MRIIAFILIMYFGALMAQPFINIGLQIKNESENCHTGMCCNKMGKQHGKIPARQQNNSCNHDLCNPFVPCGISIVYGLPLHNFASKAFATPVKLIPAINEDIISDYLSDCWHPPKLS